jgi:hypothetical protein
MKDLVDLTDRERFVLSYYRDPSLASWQRYAILQGVLVVVSLAFFVLAIIQHDRAWAFVAYAILLWRTCDSIWRARLFIDSYRSIILKYEAKIVELAGRGV